jgi:hypothetical protein
MPSRPEASSVLIVFFYFLFADHFLPSFPIHCMSLYFHYIVFTSIGCAWFPIYNLQTFKINSDNILLIAKYTLSTIIHTGVMVCWHGNIHYCILHLLIVCLIYLSHTVFVYCILHLFLHTPDEKGIA